jgi:hypothetical protein
VIHRRGALPALVMLVLVAVGAAAGFVRAGAAPSSAGAPGIASRQRSALDILRALAAVERAFDTAHVRALCRPGRLVDPAVIRLQQRRARGCRGELRSLIRDRPPLRLAPRGLELRGDRAIADVAIRRGRTVRVALVRRDGIWLLSTIGGHDPWPALAGAV